MFYETFQSCIPFKIIHPMLFNFLLASITILLCLTLFSIKVKFYLTSPLPILQIKVINLVVRSIGTHIVDINDVTLKPSLVPETNQNSYQNIP